MLSSTFTAETHQRDEEKISKVRHYPFITFLFLISLVSASVLGLQTAAAPTVTLMPRRLI